VGKVFVEITTSLDGFVAGPNDGPDLGLGEGGERLHEWIFGLASWREAHGLEGGETSRDSEILDENVRRTGAIVLGKRMYVNAHGWGDEPPFGKPVFVLTHEVRAPETKADTTFTFVNDGIESALEQAREAAGEKDVAIGGGANTIQQALRAGLVDELHLHVAPLLLGGGVRLFEELDGPVELERIRLVDSQAATHLSFGFRS
jgi:dihydrofolate reductase